MTGLSHSRILRHAFLQHACKFYTSNRNSAVSGIDNLRYVWKTGFRIVSFWPVRRHNHAQLFLPGPLPVHHLLMLFHSSRFQQL
jgi:hypothetical protein